MQDLDQAERHDLKSRLCYSFPLSLPSSKKREEEKENSQDLNQCWGAGASKEKYREPIKPKYNIVLFLGKTL